MDIEAAVVPVVQAAFPAPTRVLTSTPNDLETILPVIKLHDTGGSGDVQRMDRQGVEFDVFTATDDSTLAWQVYRWCMEQMPDVLGKVGVLGVDDSTLPIETSYANPDVHRHTFNIVIRTHDRRL